MAQKSDKTTKKRGRKPRKPDPGPVRQKYTGDTRAEAKDLYLRGVGLDRVSRYLGVPVRTLTNWQTKDRWKEAKDPAAAALDLQREGYRQNEIAARLEVSEKTVRRWLRAARQSQG